MKTLLAISVLMTTIVGVGMFGIPYAGIKSGFMFTAVFLFVLTIVMTLIHLFYAKIVVATEEMHRLPGYANYYLGKKAKNIVGIFMIAGFYGSLLVYIIVGGNFLHNILAPILGFPQVVFNLIFFIIGIVAVYYGIKLIAGLDLLMGILLIAIVFVLLYFGIDKVNVGNLQTISIKNIFAPYGVILYSLAGIAAIPETISVLNKENGRYKRRYKRAIIWGTVIPGILYLIFAFVVMGITGQNTSMEAISGLVGTLGSKIVLLGSVFGFLATITSFFILGLSLRESYIYDFGFNKKWAWFITCFAPVVLFALGVQNFVLLITILGALIGLIECVVVILIHKKVIKRQNFLSYALICLFITGFICTVLNLVKH